MAKPTKKFRQTSVTFWKKTTFALLSFLSVNHYFLFSFNSLWITWLTWGVRQSTCINVIVSLYWTASAGIFQAVTYNCMKQVSVTKILWFDSGGGNFRLLKLHLFITKNYNHQISSIVTFLNGCNVWVPFYQWVNISKYIPSMASVWAFLHTSQYVLVKDDFMGNQKFIQFFCFFFFLKVLSSSRYYSRWMPVLQSVFTSSHLGTAMLSGLTFTCLAVTVAISFAHYKWCITRCLQTNTISQPFQTSYRTVTHQAITETDIRWHLWRNFWGKCETRQNS